MSSTDASVVLQRIGECMVPADLDVLNCIDDRRSDGISNGVEIPGAIFGVIDAVKAIRNIAEEEAWKAVVRAGIPLFAHLDTGQGARGCGYARLVEDTPNVVLAVESVRAQERLERLLPLGGHIVTYVGHHHPDYAVINDREGFSFDPESACAQEFGVFNYDRWAARRFAQRLSMDPDGFAGHLENVFRGTVSALSPISDFVVIPG